VISRAMVERLPAAPIANVEYSHSVFEDSIINVLRVANEWHDAPAWPLDKAGNRILLVDADPQASAQIENRRKTLSHRRSADARPPQRLERGERTLESCQPRSSLSLTTISYCSSAELLTW
jgi:hypothetical protein